MNKWWVLTLVSLLASTSYAAEIKLYMYHKQPPFVIDESIQQGLVYEVASLLNKQSDSSANYQVEVMPRPRLNQELDGWRDGSCQSGARNCDNNWVVFWVTPKWGWGANAEQQFRWVDLFRDADLLVSHKAQPVEVATLPGHVFGAVRGHKYPPEIEDPIINGELVRQDGNNEGDVLDRLANNRVDVTMIQQSALDYMYRHDERVQALQEHLHIAEFKNFTLQVMIPNDRADLEQQLSDLTRTPEWRSLFDRYQINI